VLDIRDLPPYDPNTGLCKCPAKSILDLHDFVRFASDTNGTATLDVDVNGTGGAATIVAPATLQGVAASGNLLHELIANGNLAS
jgi:hypothetical protein